MSARSKNRRYVIKASGERELFDPEKLRRSLARVGASQDSIEEILRKIEDRPQLKTTQEIYSFAFDILKKISPPLAARYNLKKALQELGPAGFPFEEFIAQLFKAQGYTAKIHQFVDGKCVRHEVDLIVERDNRHGLVECKFHSHHGLKTNVKVALYSKARFDDIDALLKESKQDRYKFHDMWVVTNTKLTTDAIDYAHCVGMKALSWSYPAENNLAQLIDQLGLHPITALTSLNRSQKRAFIKKGLVLCREAQDHKELFKELGIPSYAAEKIINESQELCELPQKNKKRAW